MSDRITKSENIAKLRILCDIDKEQDETVKAELRKELEKLDDVYKTIREQVAIVSRYGTKIQSIENPHYEVQWAAVNSMPEAIEFINDPSYEICALALKQNKHPKIAGLLKNVSENFQHQLVILDVRFAYYFKPEYESVLLKATSIDPTAMIPYINDHPKNEKLQRQAIKMNPMLIKAIRSPSEELQLLAVTTRPYEYDGIFSALRNPSFTVACAAVEANLRRINSLLISDVIESTNGRDIVNRIFNKVGPSVAFRHLRRYRNWLIEEFYENITDRFVMQHMLQTKGISNKIKVYLTFKLSC